MPFLSFQGGSIPMYAALQYSSLVKVHGQAEIGLDFWFNKTRLTFVKFLVNFCNIALAQLSGPRNVWNQTPNFLPWKAGPI